MIVGMIEMCIKEINIKSRLYNYYFEHLIKVKKKLETKSISADKNNYKGFVIYFTRYDDGKSIMLSLYYHELVGKIEKHQGKKTDS